VTGLAAKEITAFGGQVVKNVAIPFTATDMSSYAGQAVAAGANAVINILGSSQGAQVAKAFRAQGSKVPIVNNAIVANGAERRAEGPAAKGDLIASNMWDFLDTSRAYVRQAQAEFKAAGQNAKYLDTLMGPQGWAVLHVVADALKAAKLKP